MSGVCNNLEGMQLTEQSEIRHRLIIEMRQGVQDSRRSLKKESKKHLAFNCKQTFQAPKLKLIQFGNGDSQKAACTLSVRSSPKTSSWTKTLKKSERYTNDFHASGPFDRALMSMRTANKRSKFLRREGIYQQCKSVTLFPEPSFAVNSPTAVSPMFRQLRASKVLESQQKDKEVLAETLETVEPNLNRMHKIPKLSIYEWFPTQANQEPVNSMFPPGRTIKNNAYQLAFKNKLRLSCRYHQKRHSDYGKTSWRWEQAVRGGSQVAGHNIYFRASVK